jgi:hypothetical protein
MVFLCDGVVYTYSDLCCLLNHVLSLNTVQNLNVFLCSDITVYEQVCCVLPSNEGTCQNLKITAIPWLPGSHLRVCQPPGIGWYALHNSAGVPGRLLPGP